MLKGYKPSKGMKVVLVIAAILLIFVVVTKVMGK
jgi:hypothetical protein